MAFDQSVIPGTTGFDRSLIEAEPHSGARHSCHIRLERRSGFDQSVAAGMTIYDWSLVESDDKS